MSLHSGGFIMKKKKIITNIIGMVLSVTLLASLVLSFTDNTGRSVLRVILSIVALLALVCAVVYFIRRDKESGSGWLQAFTIFLALTYFLSLLHGIILAHSIVACALTALAFGFVCSLATTRHITEDLGRTKALALSVLVIVFELVPIVITSVQHFSIPRILRGLSSIVLALILLSLILLKNTEEKK